jgi:glutamate racemase
MDKIKTDNLIGVFDSGLGGLTVFQHFLKKLPDYNYLYLGDNARLPYGSKSQETIYRYVREALDFLFAQGCRLVIIACNTASSQALRRLQQEYLPQAYPDRRVLGVIRPLAEALADGGYRRLGVIGTKATVNSGAYASELKKLAPEAEVFQQSAPLLVPLIEEGWAKKPETKMILKKYLHPLRLKQVDALALGCTHYPFLYQEIKQIMGRRVAVPHPGEIIAAKLESYLKRHPELGIRPSAQKTRRYFVTDDPNTFKRMAEGFLGEKIDKLEKAVIDRD